MIPVSLKPREKADQENRSAICPTSLLPMSDGAVFRRGALYFVIAVLTALNADSYWQSGALWCRAGFLHGAGLLAAGLIAVRAFIDNSNALSKGGAVDVIKSSGDTSGDAAGTTDDTTETKP